MAKKRALKITAIVLAIIFTVISVIALCCEIATRVCDEWEPWRPSYAQLSQQELAQILDKGDLTEQDYQTLYMQTGLSEVGINRLLQSGNRQRIFSIQQDFFADYSITKERFAPFTCWEKVEGVVDMVNIQPGDVLVTSATHVLGFRYGHSALVVNSFEVLESFCVGSKSELCVASMIQDYASFMVLRPKVSNEVVENVVNYALENLQGIHYSLTTGIFSKKNQKNIDRTHCAHLVWYAYKQFGIDLDSNGGNIVKPQDISNSEYLEVVQVYGFDPIKLWN